MRKSAILLMLLFVAASALRAQPAPPPDFLAQFRGSLAEMPRDPVVLRGRVYVPAHSSLLVGGGKTRLDLSVTLSIHNTSEKGTLILERIDYFNAGGQPIETDTDLCMYFLGEAGVALVPGSAFELPCDMVLLAMGFTGAERHGVVGELGVALDARGSVAADDSWSTNVEGVFVCGDMTRGQSLIVWAIAEGRHAAYAIDEFLMGSSDLPKPLVYGNHARPFV